MLFFEIFFGNKSLNRLMAFGVLLVDSFVLRFFGDLFALFVGVSMVLLTIGSIFASFCLALPCFDSYKFVMYLFMSFLFVSSQKAHKLLSLMLNKDLDRSKRRCLNRTGHTQIIG